MNSNEKTSSGGRFMGALQLALIILKLLGKIKWSWVWVLSPAWVTIGIAILFIIIYIWLRR